MIKAIHPNEKIMMKQEILDKDSLIHSYLPSRKRRSSNVVQVVNIPMERLYSILLKKENNLLEIPRVLLKKLLYLVNQLIRITTLPSMTR